MDSALIDRNIARVLSGFISESPKNCAETCERGTCDVATRTIAQTRGITQ